MLFNKNYSSIIILVSISLLSLFYSCSQGNSKTEKTALHYVNPFLGTDFFGHTFPGPALPNALVHLSPDTGTKGWNNAAGYTYQTNSILGFSHTHWNGVGMASRGDILIIPTVNNKLQITPGSEEHPEEGYRSRYSHQKELAEAGYYQVKLLDYNVNVELTTTPRVGFHRYTFPETNQARIIFDLGHQIGETQSGKENRLKIIGKNRIEGKRGSGRSTVYFVAEFSKPFTYYGTFDNEFVAPESGHGIFPYKNEESGNKIGAFFQYATNENEEILVKVGISYTSIDGARANLKEEIPHWDFDKIREEAKHTWEEELSKVKITTTNTDQKEIFYTALYHSLLSQCISQDVDGAYYGSDQKAHTADYNFYGTFSAWDTYRTQHPLLTILQPNDVNNYIKSIEAKTRNYGWLPGQHFSNIFAQGMVGDHLIPIIVDAYLKGYRDFDSEFLYESMRKKALEYPTFPLPRTASRSGLDDYITLGYAPIDHVTEAVPNTLELAYDDWCIAQMAKEMGKDDDYNLFIKRAGNYANVWDAKTMFMRPRLANGNWLPGIEGREQSITQNGQHSYYTYFDPLTIGRRPNRHYTESNAWQYLWSVQHDVNGMVQLYDNEEAFITRLDSFFNLSTDVTLNKYVGTVGTIGQYVQGNQPSHHVAYLYNYVGQPWKTQEKVRQVMDLMYQPGPGGLCGNEDMGSLSSWYVFSALGFYPVTPGNPTYTLGSPLFDEAIIDVGKGKKFKISTSNNSAANIYIQHVQVNGKDYTKPYITHADIMNGGKIHFEMGSTPNKKWGVAKNDRPPSMTN